MNAGVAHASFVTILVVLFPLGDVMTADEFDRVVGHVRHIVCLLIILFDATGVGEEVTAEGGVDGYTLGLDLREVLLHFRGEWGVVGSDGGGSESRKREY